ncbi:MAG TPA: metalloregulator ArsR/SmtB family transcription factor [Chthonomonadaceae bacterium]|nr:metalloregulator ArsR/SmtB family transcription factor [Chthonomonadaceae bacterium]
MKTIVRERASQLFDALSHPTRLRIVELLCQKQMTVNQVAAALNLGQSGASQHLAILARAGVLRVEPQGASRIYRVRGPRIVRILALIEEFCAVHELYGISEEEGELESEHSRWGQTENDANPR